MSVMDKLINAMKFNDDPYDEENEGEEGEYFDEAPEKEEPAFDKEEDEMEELENSAAMRNSRRRPAPERESAPAPRPSVKRQYNESGMEVCIVKPTSVNDARDVTDLILAGSTVVLNLEGLDVDIAQRIIDFTSGSCYAVQGNVMKISHYIFVITPSSVDISGDISTPAGADQDGSAALDMPFTGR
ncbi:MAG: cell division protein SepF [Lachnospiraceae bacterium]|nr:cell division protein SepF [Sarcina sp.]MBQ6590251.1 cell division protein SepF [Lachnospiraceae bacterium]